MARAASSTANLAKLAVGAAIASHGVADAKANDLGKVRMVGPDPIPSQSAEAASAQGKMLLAANNLPQALQAYRQALAQDPDSVEALNGIAVCYDRLGRYEDSRLHYEAALGLDPTSPMLLNNYGLSLYLQGDVAEATRFLRLAAASGDPEVQAASLRTLARIEQAQRAAPAPRPPVQMVSADDSGPRVVRTSGYELRLVLDKPRAPAAVQLAAADRPADQVAAIAPVGDLTPADDQRIARAEAVAIAAEYAAAARAEAQSQAAARAEALAAAVPSDMQVARWLASASASSPVHPDDAPLPLPPVQALITAPAPAAPDWHRDQILAMAPTTSRPEKDSADAANLRMAMLAAGLAPPRPSQRAMLAAAARAALDPEAPRRAFSQPFESDNGRLNMFAHRIHAEEADAVPDVAEQIARLEALIARVQAA